MIHPKKKIKIKTNVSIKKKVFAIWGQRENVVASQLLISVLLLCVTCAS